MLYSDFKIYNTNNGYSSEPFTPTRGLFQGNPYSSFSFIMIIEILANEIQNNLKIEGIRYKDFEALLSLFADDINIFIANKPSVWTELQSIIRHFEEISGLKINNPQSID